MQTKTKTQLTATLCKTLVENQAERVISMQTGCKSMLKNNKLDELTEMYKLFSKVETTLKHILNEMAPYIEERGKCLIEDEEL